MDYLTHQKNLRELIKSQEADLQNRKEATRYIKEIEQLEQQVIDPQSVLQEKLEAVKGNQLDTDLQNLTPEERKKLYQDPQYRQAHRKYVADKVADQKAATRSPIDDLRAEHQLKTLERTIEQNKKLLRARPSEQPERYAGYGNNQRTAENQKALAWLKANGKLGNDTSKTNLLSQYD